MTVIKTLFLC